MDEIKHVLFYKVNTWGIFALRKARAWRAWGRLLVLPAGHSVVVEINVPAWMGIYDLPVLSMSRGAAINMIGAAKSGHYGAKVHA